ncbi:MAG: hypothetical protein OIF56_02390 [Cohaesibacter sp.]|nr:hypothetical protein [Cohaesibacter sp.]
MPYPFTIDEGDFKADGINHVKEEKIHKTFHIHQKWLEGSQNAQWLIDTIIDLVKKARSTSHPINGIVLPEYSITWDIFQNLSRALEAECETLEFLIAGSSDNCHGQKGNIVLDRTFNYADSNDTQKKVVEELTISRRKHHRWCLNGEQIRSYGLKDTLDDNSLWWESHQIGLRRVVLTEFRFGTTYVPIICEDLARIDPCHDQLRSMGPNIVFALLMDGPQMTTRWPAKYAHSLADDPGCSVLSLTSKALVNRSNIWRAEEKQKKGEKPTEPNNSIGLWKDSTSEPREIECPDGYNGVVLILKGEDCKMNTICGRRTREHLVWKYHNHIKL